MAEHTTSSEDYFDDLVGASFAENLSPTDVSKVIKTILYVASGEAAQGILFLGLTLVEVNLESIRLQLRFSRRQEELLKLDALERDELPRRMSRFIWHLFARIDALYPLKASSLPSGFRNYINLEE